MGRIARSWSIMKSSFRILGQNKKLLFFPIINFIIVLFICSLFILPAGYYVYDQFNSKSNELKISSTTTASTVQPADATTTESDHEMTATEWAIWAALYIAAILITVHFLVLRSALLCY